MFLCFWFVKLCHVVVSRSLLMLQLRFVRFVYNLYPALHKYSLHFTRAPQIRWDFENTLSVRVSVH